MGAALDSAGSTALHIVGEGSRAGLLWRGAGCTPRGGCRVCTAALVTHGWCVLRGGYKRRGDERCFVG